LIGNNFSELSFTEQSAVAELCAGDFKAFCQLAFRFVYRDDFIWQEDLHGTIERELMLLWTGEQRNTILNMPPRYGKTIMVILFCAWAYGHNPTCEFLHLSFSDKLTTRNSSQIKDVMKSDFFKAIFKTEINPKKDSVEDWQTTEGGIFAARATHAQVTGFGAGKTIETDSLGSYQFSGFVWVDDPIKSSDAHTIRREKINDAWHETIKSRRNAKTTPTLVTMQRIHEGDFTAELMADQSEAFKCVKMKALRDDGTALWPFKHDVIDLENMRETNLFVFTSQYQQEPTAKGGTIFQADWWEYYQREPEEGFERVISTADTAQKTKEHNDFSVVQLWGLHRNAIYLIDQSRGKWQSDQLKDMMVKHLTRWKASYPRFNSCYIEDAASGTGLIQSLPGLTSVPILPVQRKKDKVTRAYDAAPYVQGGMVRIPSGQDWVEMFVSECSSFNAEDTHLHDDQVDPMMDAIDILLDKVRTAESISLMGMF